MDAKGIYDCPYCGVDREPCHGEAQIRERTQAGDAQCASALTHIVSSRARRDILAERMRQVSAEGYSFEHDDNHARGELAAAAACYALPVAVYTGCLAPFPPRGTLGLKLANHVWPWAPGSFRRKSRREDLIHAAALLIAEVERLDRLEVRGK